MTVEFFEGTQDVLKARSIQEARAGKVSFDFIDTGQNWPDYQATKIVDGTYSPEFNVYASAYNIDLVKEADLPNSLDGFSDSKWKGQLAIEARCDPTSTARPFSAAKTTSSTCWRD